ncbi:hypothetical protein ACWF0M_04510 [Kribbella sp. NPDC055110]
MQLDSSCDRFGADGRFRRQQTNDFATLLLEPNCCPRSMVRVVLIMMPSAIMNCPSQDRLSTLNSIHPQPIGQMCGVDRDTGVMAKSMDRLDQLSLCKPPFRDPAQFYRDIWHWYTGIAELRLMLSDPSQRGGIHVLMSWQSAESSQFDQWGMFGSASKVVEHLTPPAFEGGY